MTLLQIITYTGTFVFALSGALKARSYEMDFFGGFVLAFIMSYGGGTIRDLLIGRTPVNWINDNAAIGLVIGGLIITFLLKKGIDNFKKTIFITDALGLGLFTIAGIEVSLRYGLNNLYALIMGVISATFGGLISDIVCNEVPNLLKRGELYATVCALGGTLFLLLKNTALSHDVNLIICVFITAGIRIYSKRKKIQLPNI